MYPSITAIAIQPPTVRIAEAPDEVSDGSDVPIFFPTRNPFLSKEAVVIESCLLNAHLYISILPSIL